jgi:large subunit ribosomal protein L21
LQTTEDAMYAVIRTGGKQYKVAPQDMLEIEKIDGAAGDAVRFSDVLMIAGDGEPRLGEPLISGASVAAEVVEQGRGPKIIVFKKKRRQNYRRKRGHRQELTTVRILEILADGQTLAASQVAAEPAKPKQTRAKAKEKAQATVEGTGIPAIEPEE